MRSYTLQCSVAISIIGWFTAQGFAAPPKVDYLFPAGGQRGTTVNVTATGTFERWPVKAWADNPGVAVKAGKGKGELSITIAKDAEPGLASIRLYDEQGASVARPFFVGVLPDVLEQEPNDDPRKPQVLLGSCVVNGRLDKVNEVDTFALKATKGQTLVASLEAQRTLRSPMDGVLQIVSEAGVVLEQNDDYHGFDPQIAFSVPKDGTYLVRVFAFPDKADSSIRFAGKDTFVYRLTVTTGPYVEYAYPLSVPRNGGAVELVGWNLPDALRTFSVKPQGAARTMKVFDSAIAEPITVRLEGQPAIVKTKATREQPQKVVPPLTITGRLDHKGDVDVYEWEAKKGQKVPIKIEARTLGFPLEPALRVTDAAGKMLMQAQAKAIGADPTLDFAPTADGTYRIEVRDLFGDAGLRHVYRLRIGPVEPDFDLKVADDRFTLMPAKPLEIPVTITRLGGYKGEIALSVEGLPKGVAMTATAKGITLRAEPGASSGPIRIVGTAKDGTVRYARATVAELGRAIDHLWLTTSK